MDSIRILFSSIVHLFKLCVIIYWWDQSRIRYEEQLLDITVRISPRSEMAEGIFENLREKRCQDSLVQESRNFDVVLFQCIFMLISGFAITVGLM